MEKKLQTIYLTYYLVNNLTKGIHRIKCKFEHNDKNCETLGIRYKYCDCLPQYTNFKDDLIE